MLFVPLPFVVALLLVLLFAVVARRDDEVPLNWPFLALIIACAAQSMLIGLRWGYDVEVTRHIMPVTGAMLPPLVYVGVRGLTGPAARRWPIVAVLHALPVFLVLVLVIFWRRAVDFGLIAIYLVYAGALLWLMRPGPDVLRLAPFDGVVPAYRALLIATGALCLSAVIDAFVVLDLTWSDGTSAPKIISIANIFGLFLLGAAAVAASRSRTPADEGDRAPSEEVPEDRETLAKVHALMAEQKLFRDANLNLDRLARKTGIPARRISTAINRAMSKNVSQYVNDCRIAEACRLLTETNISVTEIMLESGFQTKSNFNREFRRITEMSPVAWRAKKSVLA
ncbi:helix-turn-helix transcriptional regulator [Microvirga sp. c23x22]|uniref:Helix-turn-helix transcriptional regulator n=2 Tax=Microvirga terricola TaxID=2719797 RepID=A0ABX0VB69_9HYPH|nr:helix-turn-helix transcriptional regulator [Microvirga terricola]